MIIRTVTVVKQYLTAVFLIAIGLIAFGCGGNATVNPVVELASLTVSPGTLKPAFTGGTTDYTVNLTSDVTSVRITAQPAVAGDTVTINGQATTNSVIPLAAAGTTTPVSIVVSEASTNSRTYTVLLVRAGLNGNNSLQSLTVSPGALTPDFGPNVQTYAVGVANNVDSVTVTPELQDSAATMTVNGQAAASGQGSIVPLNGPGQSTLITIVVTAQDKTMNSYTILVNRDELSSINTLQTLTVSSGATNLPLDPPFLPATLGYGVDVESTVTSVKVTPTLSPNSNASMTVNEQATDSGQARTITLRPPDSTTFINIIVTAQNGNQKTYVIAVDRAPSNNNNLKALSVKVGTVVQTLSPSFARNTTTYRVDVASNVESVTVSATKDDPIATMTGSVAAEAGVATGQAPVTLGEQGSATPVSITVTPQTGNPKTYNITVTRLSGNNNLSALTVQVSTVDQTLSPPFPSAVDNRYAMNVATGVTEVTVSATKADPIATMTGSVTAGAGLATGQATISLNGAGTPTAVSITVTAQDGTSQIYSITVNRAASDDNNLSALTVEGSLVPGFAPSTTAYQVGVPANVTSVTVSATKSDPNAVMSGDVTAGTGVATGQATFLLVPLIPKTVSILVTAPNGASKAYSVTTTRAPL